MKSVGFLRPWMTLIEDICFARDVSEHKLAGFLGHVEEEVIITVIFVAAGGKYDIVAASFAKRQKSAWVF